MQSFGNPIIIIALITFIIVIVGSIITFVKHSIDKSTRTPLMRAVMKHDESAVSKLIDQGANVNETTQLGNTALILAAKSNNTSLVKLLIEKGADINLVGSQQGSDLNTSVNATALLYAIQASNNEIIQYLLNRGADANLGSHLQHATQKRDVETIKLLLSHGANPSDASIIIAAQNNDFNSLKCLVDGGANVNINVGKICSYNDNIPPMHWAIKNKNLEMLKYLIDHGADTNGSYSYQIKNTLTSQVTTTTLTPLDTARSNREMKAILIEAGAK